MMRRWLCFTFLALMLAGGGAVADGGEYGRLLEESGLPGEDLTAFLEIPGADFVLPVMQHGEDDSHYLAHDASGEESASGALYTERTYSAPDFSDPVTVIYGRRMSDGSMFGSLQEWYSGSFDACRTIMLHLPGESREYAVFAAVPYSGIHLLHYNDFRYERAINSFLSSVFSTRRLGVQLDDENRPEAGEQMIILSTSLKGDATQRYLVIAKLIESETN